MSTPRHGWPTPADTDFVKDGAAAIRDLGDAIDATPLGLSAVVTFTASGTFEKASYPWMRAVRVRLVAGGGGGGGVPDTSADADAGSAGGGGAGAYGEHLVPVASLASSEPITVGAGGSGGAPGGGSAGGETSFGALCAVRGGAGGSGGQSSAFRLTTSGGFGGQAGSPPPQVGINGGRGSAGRCDDSRVTGFGDGAPSIFGGGGTGTAGNVSATGTDAIVPGSGGQGAFGNNAAARAGGAGADGLVIVEVYG